MRFRCIVPDSLPEVQWIAEPFVHANDSLAIIEIFPNTLGTPIPVGSATIVHLSMNPFITELILNGSTAQASTNVSCSTINPVLNETLPYLFSGKIYRLHNVYVSHR